MRPKLYKPPLTLLIAHNYTLLLFALTVPDSSSVIYLGNKFYLVLSHAESFI